jgi:hypothetical protein
LNALSGPPETFGEVAAIMPQIQADPLDPRIEWIAIGFWSSPCDQVDLMSARQATSQAGHQSFGSAAIETMNATSDPHSYTRICCN